MKPDGKIYGEWFLSVPPVKPSSADRILGVQLLHDKQGRPDQVDLQFQSAESETFQAVRMDYVNALFLLSCLKSMQLDEGTPFPDDPRANPS